MVPLALRYKIQEALKGLLLFYKSLNIQSWKSQRFTNYIIIQYIVKKIHLFNRKLHVSHTKNNINKTVDFLSDFQF